jgi:hypothetical protein
MLECDGEELKPISGPLPGTADCFSPWSFLWCDGNGTSSISITRVLLHVGQVRTFSPASETIQALYNISLKISCYLS